MKEPRKGGRIAKAPATAAPTRPKAQRSGVPRKKAAAGVAAVTEARSEEPTRVPRATVAATRSALAKVSSLCLALPDTKLTMTWGSPHFRVGEKIFCGFGEDDGRATLGVKLRLEHARVVVKEARFSPAKYVGKHGWVTMDLSQRKGWDEVAALIRESYELIAPRASRAKLR